MATRMTTLAYGESSDELFAHDSGAYPIATVRSLDEADDDGDRDTFDESREPFAPTPSVREQPSTPRQPVVPPSPAAPAGPPPSPWTAMATATGPSTRPVALPSMLVGLVIAAAVLAGLALCGMAIAWASSLSGLAYFAMMGVGGYLLASGVAMLVAAPTLRLTGAELDAQR